MKWCNPCKLSFHHHKCCHKDTLRRVLDVTAWFNLAKHLKSTKLWHHVSLILQSCVCSQFGWGKEGRGARVEALFGEEEKEEEEEEEKKATLTSLSSLELILCLAWILRGAGCGTERGFMLAYYNVPHTKSHFISREGWENGLKGMFSLISSDTIRPWVI